MPPVPALPQIDWADLTLPFEHMPDSSEDAATYDSALEALEEYEALLVDSLLEHRARLQVICETGDATTDPPE